jgi:hypothetical protein
MRVSLVASRSRRAAPDRVPVEVVFKARIQIRGGAAVTRDP